jgi:murein tripeptide amidase MpaA
MDFNRYFTNDDLSELLHRWAKEYPELVELHQIGRSYEGRPITAVILTLRSNGSHSEKPAVWLDANIHATEIAGTTVVLHTLWTLLSRSDETQVRELLSKITIYAVPRVNPDGAALAMATPPRYLRSGVRPYPYEDLAEGLHEEDIDGDGRILQMRIRDPHGEWKISTKHPLLMERRAPDEHGGEYYRVLPEGRIENFDGYLIKLGRRREGLDFNRNFPFEWRPEGDQFGAGPYPTSEPEIQAMVDFIARHPNINIALTYHTFSGVILRPYGTKADDELDTSDLWVYQALGARGTELTGYPCLSVYHDFRYHPKEIITGTFDDWVYDHFGIYTFTVELWDLVGRAGITERKFIDWFRDHPHEDDVKIIDYVMTQLGGEGYHPWRVFEHAQLGTVEIGGWDRMYTWRNPPVTLIREEAERNTAWVMSLTKTLPSLEIHTLEITPLGDSNYRVTVVVENAGYLPSYTSEQTKKRKTVRPLRATIHLPPGASLITGKPEEEIGHVEGRSRRAASFGPMVGEGTGNRAVVRWVVRVPEAGAITVRVSGERIGTVTQTRTIE